MKILFISTLTAFIITSSSGDLLEEASLVSYPCHVDNDPIYHGVRLICQNKTINSLKDLENRIPTTTTTLLLDYNVIDYLDKAAFPSSQGYSWTTLRYLGLSNNKISKLQPYAFSALVSLEKLDLSHNQIDLNQSSLIGRVFDGLGNLEELDLTNNGNQGEGRKYDDLLFSDLRILVTLGLDTFSGNLDFGSIFQPTTKLSNLTLTGGMTAMVKDSFISFKDSIQLKKLVIRDVNELNHTDIETFQYLQYLNWYEISGSLQELRIILKSLKPFVEHPRNMTHLTIARPYFNYQLISSFKGNSVLTRDMSVYLSEICVEHFSLTATGIVLLDHSIVTNRIWQKCLISLDLSDNPIVEDLFLMLSFSVLEHLEYIKISCGKYVWRHFGEITCQSKIHSNKKISTSKKVTRFNGDVESHDNEVTPSVEYISDKGNDSEVMPSAEHILDKINFTNGIINRRNTKEESTLQRQKNHWHLFKNSNVQRHHDTFIFRFPKHLKIAIFTSKYFALSVSINKAIIIDGGELEELHAADNEIMVDKSADFIKGLPNLKLFDISKNDGSKIASTFFNFLRSLEFLYMADMNLKSDFMSDQSHQLFNVLTHIRALDLSKNKLNSLEKNTFLTNTKLSVLKLADNRFESIPFELQHVPNLHHLDMRRNSLRSLSNDDINDLESHARSFTSFSLYLDGNVFSCGCQNIRFILWLQRTEINLHNNKNYSCILDSGNPTTTGQMLDVDAIWRKCNGQKALWVTLVLACFMILGYLCCLVIPKLKTQLKAFILKSFWPRFIRKNQADYPIGVYIGYADHDINLACLKLRPFIENQLGLTTYVRHRDLLPASDIAETIMEAVHSSWRVLLVVSPHFLDDPWSYFILKASTFAVQAENPGRIVLIVTNDDDYNYKRILLKIPGSVLQAVQEESIISMTSLGNVSYEDKQALITALG